MFVKLTRKKWVWIIIMFHNVFFLFFFYSLFLWLFSFDFLFFFQFVPLDFYLFGIEFENILMFCSVKLNEILLIENN